jgi:RNA polymerase sigma factor (sigma-70 family)
VGSGALVMSRPVTALAEAPERDSDAELVAAVRRGDERAFEQLYSRYQRRISAYVFGMVKDHGRAEDITQEVFISALRRMRETDRAIHFKPWVYEIAKNACIDQFRRSRRAEEVSFDAGEAQGGADHARLVASEPTPDVAVDAKQQLDHLCGAFGGLSDSHHEILVLREFEGLSYREIGDRMGLSRPGVESTLFRARKRLTEEYDELVTGQRCVRIQSIIASAARTALGARDTRRLARHLSHCQPCRRQAVAAGIDAAILAPRPARRRITEKVAGFLPLPAFLRTRGWHGGEQMVPVSEPMAAAWSKAVAVAATLVVAGVGAGVAPQHGGGSVPAQGAKAKPAAASGSSAATAAPKRARVVSGATSGPARRQRAATLRSSGGHGKATAGAGTKNAQPRGTGVPSSSSPAGSGGSQASTPTRQAGVNPGPSAPKPAWGVTAPSTPAGGDTPSTPSLPPVSVPNVDVPVSGTEAGGGQVNQAIDQTTQTVNQTVDQTTQAAQGTVDGVTGALPQLGG